MFWEVIQDLENILMISKRKVKLSEKKTDGYDEITSR